MTGSSEPTPLSSVVARAWRDAGYAELLQRDPRAALQEFGINVAEGADVVVHFNTTEAYHLVIPGSPRRAALSDDDLEELAGVALYPTEQLVLPTMLR
jgi:hypothetical protein